MVLGKPEKITHDGHLKRYKMKRKVLLKAPILTQSGYGEHSRFIFRALLEKEDMFDIFVEPLNWGTTSWQWETSEERKKIDLCISKFHHVMREKIPNFFDVCIHVDLPTAWNRVAPMMIGVTAGIEADAVCPSWLQPCLVNVEKIIVPSKFSKEGIVNAIDKYSHAFDENTRNSLEELRENLEDKITVVNYPVKKYDLVDLDLELETDFNFLLVAQWTRRKNMEETVRAFFEEFKDDEGVGLIVKTNTARNCLPDRFVSTKKLQAVKADYPDAKCKMYLLHGSMTNDEIHSLYNHPKVKFMLNFGHGEGYGLPLFEAAYCGLPIIAHDFGGQKDFLYAPKKNKKGASKMRPHFNKIVYNVRQVQNEAVWADVIERDAAWAYPNFSSCKVAMRAGLNNHGMYLGHSKKLKSWVEENFAEKDKNSEIIETIFEEELKIEEEIDDLFNKLEL